MDQTRYQNTDQNKIFSGAAVDYLTAGQKANIRPYNNGEGNVMRSKVASVRFGFEALPRRVDVPLHTISPTHSRKASMSQAR